MPRNPDEHKVSLVITAWNEARTVARALEIYAAGTRIPDEVLLICPDPETRQAGEQWQHHFPHMQILTDPRQGKPHALNIALSHTTHPLVICTDGDVLPDQESISQLLQAWASGDAEAVSGHPISADPRSTMLGYWSHFLVDAAHRLRQQRQQQGTFLYVSGYLFLANKSLLPQLPADILSDDAYISDMMYAAGHSISYAAKAHIYIHYPKTYSDWILQKRRSAGGFLQLKGMTPPKQEMRSFTEEVKEGLSLLWTYPRNWQERWWTLLLTLARLHLWALIFWDQKILRKDSSTLWKRVESSKQ